MLFWNYVVFECSCHRKIADNKIGKYIRELIKYFNKKDSNIHYVESESSETILNQIIVAIPKENPVITPSIGDWRIFVWKQLHLSSY